MDSCNVTRQSYSTSVEKRAPLTENITCYDRHGGWGFLRVNVLIWTSQETFHPVCTVSHMLLLSQPRARPAFLKSLPPYVLDAYLPVTKIVATVLYCSQYRQITKNTYPSDFTRKL